MNPLESLFPKPELLVMDAVIKMVERKLDNNNTHMESVATDIAKLKWEAAKIATEIAIRENQLRRAYIEHAALSTAYEAYTSTINDYMEVPPTESLKSWLSMGEMRWYQNNPENHRTPPTEVYVEDVKERP